MSMDTSTDAGASTAMKRISNQDPSSSMQEAKRTRTNNGEMELVTVVCDEPSTARRTIHTNTAILGRDDKRLASVRPDAKSAGERFEPVPKLGVLEEVLRTTHWNTMGWREQGRR